MRRATLIGACLLAMSGLVSASTTFARTNRIYQYRHVGVGWGHGWQLDARIGPDGGGRVRVVMRLRRDHSGGSFCH